LRKNIALHNNLFVSSPTHCTKKKREPIGGEREKRKKEMCDNEREKE